ALASRSGHRPSVSAIGPRKLSAMVASFPSPVSSRREKTRPTLFTSRSRRSRRPPTRPASRRLSAISRWSTAKNSTSSWPATRRNSATAVCPRASSRPVTTTLSPRVASARASSKPMPAVPPVTSATDRSISEAGLDRHVPGDDHEDQEDQPHAPDPAAQEASGLVVVACFRRALRSDRRAALEDHADQDGGGKQRERDHEPDLGEAPGAAVDDHPDAEPKDATHRGCKDERADELEVADELGDGCSVAASENSCGEQADGERAAHPDHGGEDVQEHQPLVEVSCDH